MRLPCRRVFLCVFQSWKLTKNLEVSRIKCVSSRSLSYGICLLKYLIWNVCPTSRKVGVFGGRTDRERGTGTSSEVTADGLAEGFRLFEEVRGNTRYLT